jgi:hypothetical protein
VKDLGKREEVKGRGELGTGGGEGKERAGQRRTRREDREGKKARGKEGV